MSPSALYQGIVVPAISLVPITAGFIYYKRINRPLHTLLVYLCIGFFTDVAASYTGHLNINNLPLLHIWTAFELVACTLYYKHAFANKQLNKWLIAIMIIYPVLCVVNFSFFQSIYTFNTYTRPLAAIIIIVLSILYLSGQSGFEKTDFIHKGGRWVASGFLIYFCSSLFLFIFANVLHQHTSKFVRVHVWDMHATFALMMYIFFFVAILNERSKR